MIAQRRWTAAGWAVIAALAVAIITLPSVGVDAWRALIHLLPIVSAETKKYTSPRVQILEPVSADSQNDNNWEMPWSRARWTAIDLRRAPV